MDDQIAIGRAAEAPVYRAQQAPASSGGRGGRGFRVYLGTLPDYANTDVVGVRLSGVAAGGPAERAGLAAGDTIVAVAGRAIENLYDFMYTLDAMRSGETVAIVVERGGERVDLEVVPGSRD